MNRIALLALAFFALFALAIRAIARTEAWWVVALTVIAAMAVFTVIGHDVRKLMDDDDEEDGGDAKAPAYDGAPVRPGVAFAGVDGDRRAVVVAAQPLTAEEVLPALGVTDDAGRLSVMVVTPRAIGHHVAVDDERHYVAAHEAEGRTVDALRRAGVHATGHVGDHDPTQAVADALALFPAPRVVVMAGGDAAATLHEHLDVDAVTGASVEFVDLRVGRSR